MGTLERHMKHLDALVERIFGWNELAETLARFAVFGPIVAVLFCWLLVAAVLGKE
jgi:hypothetical protein